MKGIEEEREPALRDWIAIFGAILGAFMAVLDIQITNASLRDIQGGLAASLDEGTWISTAYLIAEIITIPLSPWLSDIFSTKRFLIANCVLFLIFSMLCGLSTSLPMMIVCRAGQGFTGGVFSPTAMTIVLRCLPPSKQPIGLSLFSVTATFAPAIGPTLGGWLTDTYSWHWIFYINLVPGLVVIWAIAYGLKGDRMHPRTAAPGRLGRDRVHGDRPRLLDHRARGRPAQGLVRQSANRRTVGPRRDLHSGLPAARIAAQGPVHQPHVLSSKAPGTNVVHMQALAQIANTVRREAYVMAYSDCFFVIGIALLLSILPLFFVNKPKPGAAPAAVH